MRALAIVFLSPIFNDFSGMSDREKPVLVEALISELAIEAFDVRILLGLAGINEIQAHA